MMRTKSNRAALTVLMFHGVVRRHPPFATFSDTRTCQLRVEDFCKTLEWCARRFRFVRLSDVARYREGEATEPGALITFDDGLSSLCELAVPILLRYGATATVFVTTDWVDFAVEPPIFALERVLWMKAPVRVSIRRGDFVFQSDVQSPAAIADVMRSIWSALFSHRVAPLSLEKESIFFDERPWSLHDEDKAPDGDELWKPASWDALKSAVKAGALEIGSHGVTHTPWPWLDQQSLTAELATSKKRLEDEFDMPVSACAYPHGMNDGRTRLVTSAVFDSAFGGGAYSLRHGADRTYLPRYHVPAESPNSPSLVLRWPRLGHMFRKAAQVAGISS